MTRDGLPYASALARAQELGYAEADPTLDVDGTDAAHKLAVLAQLAFGAGVRTGEIPREGIDRLQPADITYAGELGYWVKLLALASSREGLELRVAPTLVTGDAVGRGPGPYNAVRVVGDAVGDTLFYGRGAGRCRRPRRWWATSSTSGRPGRADVPGPEPLAGLTRAPPPPGQRPVRPATTSDSRSPTAPLIATLAQVWGRGGSASPA